MTVEVVVHMIGIVVRKLDIADIVVVVGIGGRKAVNGNGRMLG